MSIYSVTDPHSGRVIAGYPTATADEIKAALADVDSAARTWSAAAPVSERARLVAEIARLHLDRIHELATVITREMGKPLDQAVAELEFAAAIYQYYADNAQDLLADESIDVETGTAIVRKAGMGALLGIMPWNFPAYQVARFAGPNLIAGNTILLKHAPQCPESAAVMEAIIHDAARTIGAPIGVYRNVYATNEQVEELIADVRLRGVSVTGSERAGSAVAQTAGKHLKKVVLELGGADPFIVLSAHNLDVVVEHAVNARMDNNGQSCNAAKRFVIIDHLYDEFAQKLTAALAAIEPGDPMVDGTRLGPLSSASASDRIEDQLDRAIAQGATVLTRGIRSGNHVPPAVLADVTPQMDAYYEEFFGPVAMLFRVRDEEDAIRVANDTPFGLGSYIYTTDADQGQRVADRIDAGMVWINLVLGDAAELPFGGTKGSGFGRELGRYAVDEFVNRKLIRTVDAPK